MTSVVGTTSFRNLRVESFLTLQNSKISVGPDQVLSLQLEILKRTLDHGPYAENFSRPSDMGCKWRSLMLPMPRGQKSDSIE
jgi:hypothetical protein